MNPTTRPYQQGRLGGEQERSSQQRRDNDIVTVPKVTLYDIDYAIYYHLVENMKLQITENGNVISVPVMYSNGEKWSQIRQNGFLRDESRKVMAPLIIHSRRNIGRLETTKRF